MNSMTNYRVGNEIKNKPKCTPKITCGVVGVSGYAGADLLKLLLHHPYFEITYLANSNGAEDISLLHPEFKDIFAYPVSKANVKEAIEKSELLFLALPHKSAMEFVKEAFKAPHIKIIDLSADYRLKLENYEKFYTKHIDQENLKHAVYGLSDWNKESIKSAKLLANPGCYPTASLLALLPFLPYIQGEVFIDAKSGVSGAGKGLTDNTHYPSINENIFSYSPLTHRHQVEIQEKCEFFASLSAQKNIKADVQINFVPHLSPFTRGMLVSVFATLKEDIRPLEILKASYIDSNFVRIREQSVRVSDVARTNICDIFALNNKRALYINSAIDNLMLGASSQALRNANIMYNFPEDTGIPRIAI